MLGFPIPDSLPLPETFAHDADQLLEQVTRQNQEEPELFTGSEKLTKLGEEVLTQARRQKRKGDVDDIFVRLARDARIAPDRLWRFLHGHKLRPSLSRTEWAAVERELRRSRWDNEPRLTR